MQATARAYDEVIDLFAKGSSSTEILRFHPSPAAQRRASQLLAKRKNDQLTTEEAAELERLGQLEHLMQLVKARARDYVESSS